MLATFKIIHEERFQCSACLAQKTTEAGLAKIREAKGCFDTNKKRYQLEEYKISTCIGNLFSSSAFFWFRNFKTFQQNGALPFPGPLMDQPAKVIEIFQLFESMEAERHREDQKQAEIKARAERGAAHGRK